MTELEDLRARLYNASETLQAMMESATERVKTAKDATAKRTMELSAAHLKSKRDGVKLAISYIDEYLRGEWHAEVQDSE